MKNLLIVSLLLVQSCMVFAQNYCMNDSSFRLIQFPLAENDTETVFFYFNNEWIAGAEPGMVKPDSIRKIEIKNDAFDNRAIFISVSPETLANLKSEALEVNRKLFVNYNPICEFPGGSGKLMEWLDANIRIPEGYKGSERVVVGFFVQPDGSITNAQMLKPSKNDAANAEALRLVGSLPKFRIKYFTPEKKPVRIAFPISFKEPGIIFIRGNGSYNNYEAVP